MSLFCLTMECLAGLWDINYVLLPLRFSQMPPFFPSWSELHLCGLAPLLPTQTSVKCPDAEHDVFLVPDTSLRLDHATQKRDQYSNTSRLSYNSIQFWHHLPGVINRLHKLKAQSHKLAPISDANHKSHVVTCTSDFGPADDKLGFPQSPPQLW